MKFFHIPKFFMFHLLVIGLLLLLATITWDHIVTLFELKMLGTYFILADIVCLVYAYRCKKKPLATSHSENPQDCKAEKERNEIIEQTTSAMSKEKIDLDKMAEEIMNSPNKIDLLIAKAEELGGRYAFDEISELYKRVKTHLTKEEKIELLEELRVRRFVAPFSAPLGPSSKD